MNGLPARLKLNALLRYGVDVALVEIPEPLARHPGLVYQRLGIPGDANRVYYTHGWSSPPELTSDPLFEKAWGPRLRRLEVAPLKAFPPHVAWSLRNDAFHPAQRQAFSARNFQVGWSGAPVFNVRRTLEAHCVIGVLRVVALDGGSAMAVSVESLEFLGEAEPQSEEGRVLRVRPGLWQSMRVILGLAGNMARPRYEIGFEDPPHDKSLYELRTEEILGGPASPPVPEPRSPLDSSSPSAGVHRL
jgi:hypothetical protein